MTARVGGNSRLATALASDFSQADLPGLATATGNLTSELSKTDGTVDLKQVASSATTLANTISPARRTTRLRGRQSSCERATRCIAPGDSRKQCQPGSGQGRSIRSQQCTLDSERDRRYREQARQQGLHDAAGRIAGPDFAIDCCRHPRQSDRTARNDTERRSRIRLRSPLRAQADGGPSTKFSTSPPVSPPWICPGILANLNLLPQKVAALDAQGAHKVAGDLNNQFSPLVKMAAGVDLKWVSQVLSVIPDPSGYSQVAALVASILANVDIIKLANLVGQVQEIAWAAVEKLLPPPGQLPDPLGAGAAMTGLVPVGLELASVAVNMLSGKATKTDPTLLGKTVLDGRDHHHHPGSESGSSGTWPVR